MKYLIMDDGYHDNLIVNDKNERMYTEDLLRRLALPHKDKVEIAVIKYEDAENDPAVPDEVMNSLAKISEEYDFSDREFNGMWYFSYGLTEGDA